MPNARANRGDAEPTWDDQLLQHGIVSCPLARLLAEDLVFSIPGITECHNELVARTMRDASLAA